MKVRYISDIHLDFWANYNYNKLKNLHTHETDSIMEAFWRPTFHQDDHKTVLVLPGDLWTEDKSFNFMGGFSWVKELSHQFYHIVIVLGNHDYWGSNINLLPLKIKEHISKQNLKNVSLLQNESVVINDPDNPDKQVKFIGATLWTDLKKGDPLVSFGIRDFMVPDFRYIKRAKTYSSFTPNDWLAEHITSHKFITSEVFDNFNGNKVIVTHHAPSFSSIDARYKQDPLYEVGNYGYYSELGSELARYPDNVKYWVHGHVHNKVNYTIGPVTVLANPLGYISKFGIMEKTGFEDFSYFEV